MLFLTPSTLPFAAKSYIIMSSLSYGEQCYIRDACKAGIRTDGRSAEQFRHFDLTLDVVPTANGSARLEMDNTHIVAAVKAEIGTPEHGEEELGRIVFNVDCTNCLSAQWDRSEGESLSAELSAILTRTYVDSGAMQRKLLGIVPGRFCWVIYVDLTVYSSSGNLADALSIAAKAALRATTIPAVTVIKRGAETGKQQEYELDVSTEHDDLVSLATWDQFLPLICSICRIGDALVLDPSLEEEECVSARLQMMVSPTGRVLGMVKQGEGGISPGLATQAMMLGATAGPAMIQQFQRAFMEALNKDEDKEVEDEDEMVDDEDAEME